MELFIIASVAIGAKNQVRDRFGECGSDRIKLATIAGTN